MIETLVITMPGGSQFMSCSFTAYPWGTHNACLVDEKGVSSFHSS